MIPPEYVGREQTWLKHKVLDRYLKSWAFKLGRKAGQRADSGRRPERLWYVDCFSGPWQARAENLSDTSVVIGLEALKEARRASARQGLVFEVGAIFIESNPAAYADLERVVAERKGEVVAHTFQGEFGQHIQAIQRLVGNDPALLLVDPTGWKGAAMAFIAPLVQRPRRDVLINVMFNHINRFKDDPRAFLLDQMKAFFGLGDQELAAGLDEEALLTLYRRRLREVCGLAHVADLAIPFPGRDRTQFRLVVGGHHKEILRLFREIEHKVLGEEAAAAQTMAKERERVERTGQPSLFAPEPPALSKRYAEDHARGLEAAEARVIEVLTERKAILYEDLWADILADYHVRELDVGQIVERLHKEGQVTVLGLEPSKRRVRDEHVVQLADAL